METYELNKIKAGYELSQFDRLCDKARYYLFDWLLSEEYSCDCINKVINYNIISPERSAIEQIFNICYFRYCSMKIPSDKKYFGIPLFLVFFDNLSAQEKISFECNNYIADFTFDLSKKCENGEYLYPKYKEIKYVIELDGYEYHSSKKQLNNDYKREQDLQELGFRIVRFTGSQIYNEPYTCIEKLVKIIMNDINKRSE